MAMRTNIHVSFEANREVIKHANLIFPGKTGSLANNSTVGYSLPTVPARAGVVLGDRPRQRGRVRTKGAFVDHTIVIDDKRHHAGLAPLRRPCEDCAAVGNAAYGRSCQRYPSSADLAVRMR